MLQVWRGSLPKDFVVPKNAERILFCGWRRDMEDMVMVILERFCTNAPSHWVQLLVYEETIAMSKAVSCLHTASDWISHLQLRYCNWKKIIVAYHIHFVIHATVKFIICFLENFFLYSNDF